LRARYRAEREVVAERYAKWEITGEPEVRRIEARTRTLSPRGALESLATGRCGGAPGMASSRRPPVASKEAAAFTGAR